MFYFQNGAPAGQRELTIQWHNVSNNGAGSGSASFQIVLSEANSQIRINYQDVTFDGTGDFGSTATIGLQSRNVLVDQHSFNQANAVADGSSLVQSTVGFAAALFGLRCRWL